MVNIVTRIIPYVFMTSLALILSLRIFYLQVHIYSYIIGLHTCDGRLEGGLEKFRENHKLLEETERKCEQFQAKFSSQTEIINHLKQV